MGCAQSKDAMDNIMPPIEEATLLQEKPRSIQMVASSKHDSKANFHRDVFSIFAEQGMALEAEQASTPYGDICSSPFSASGSVFSTATTASDTERTLTLGATNQFIAPLNVSYASYSDKGIRKQNEDRKVCTSQVINDETVAYFGVYDGHNGNKVSDHLAEHLHVSIFDGMTKYTDITTAVEDSYASIDDYIFENKIESGSTAISLVIRGKEALVAWAGDSQAILSTSGKASLVSAIHSPDSEVEKQRILSANGVVAKGRIYGLLAVSRAFGDNDFKTSRGEYKDKFKGDLVTAIPDFLRHTIADEDEFMVLACDGLFEVMQPQQVVDFVRVKLALHGDVQHACEELVSYAISIGSTDNVSVIIVCFNQTIPITTTLAKV